MVKIQPTARRTRYPRNTPPDARIVVAEGNGKLWCSSTSPGNTEAPSILFYYFATASVFDGAGHLAFTATGSGEFGNSRPAGWPRGCSKNSPAAMPGCMDRAHRLRRPPADRARLRPPEFSLA
jgi:hypothetical protein